MYYKKPSSDTWHWCRNCSKFPNGSDVVTSRTKPSSGELCNECKAKDREGNCHK